MHGGLTEEASIFSGLQLGFKPYMYNAKVLV